MISDEQVKRINALARKSREQGLTPQEQAEQAQLRRAYVDAVKQSLGAHLENTFIQNPDGSKHRLRKKDE